MADALRQALEDWKRAGVTTLPRVSDQLSFSVETESDSEVGQQSDVKVGDDAGAGQSIATGHAIVVGATTEEATVPVDAAHPEPVVEQSVTSRSSEHRLAELRTQVAACTRCKELANARTQTVFGVGNPNAEVMFIGEAPGADEDRQGEPFVGKAGQMLDRIIVASGWQRSEIYICNILRCRPPGNRNPTDREAANCREFLDGQIAAVQPNWIVCWGSVAAKNLLGVDKPIGRMRKQFFDYANAQVICTYHPSYLLRHPPAKKDVWNDLLFLFGRMGHVPPSKAK